MGGAEGVVDIENLQPARLHGRAELIEQSRGEPRRLGLARRVLQTAHGRLRAKRRARLRAAADREFHQRVVPQPVEVDGVLVPAGDRRHASRYHLKHRVPDTGRIAAIRHRISKPSAYTKLALRSPQQQQAAIRGLVTTLKIYCEFLASDRWQVKRKQHIVGHGGCGAGLIREATCLDNDLLCESATLCHSRLTNPHAGA